MKKFYLIVSLVLSDLILNAQTNTFEWAKSIGGYYGLATGIDVTVDNSNNVYTTGTFEGKVDFDPGAGVFNLTTSGYANRDIFITKSDNSGNFTWTKQITGTYSFKDVNSIALDASGNIYVSGYFSDTVDFDPGPGVYNLVSASFYNSFILKLNSSGNFVWANSWEVYQERFGLLLCLWICQEMFIQQGIFGIPLILTRGQRPII